LPATLEELTGGWSLAFTFLLQLVYEHRGVVRRHTNAELRKVRNGRKKTRSDAKPNSSF
jgi:hypothetical protein